MHDEEREDCYGITHTPCCGRFSCCSSGTRPAPLPSLIEPAANRDVLPSLCVCVCGCIGVPVCVICAPSGRRLIRHCGRINCCNFITFRVVFMAQIKVKLALRLIYSLAHYIVRSIW